MNGALAAYARILRARWRWLMWGCLLGLAAITALLLVSPPRYQSDATVFVRTPGDVSEVQDGGDSYAQGRAKTYAALMNSSAVAARVIADLGLDLDPATLSRRISATHPSGTAIIRVTLSAPSAAEAQRTLGVLLSEQEAQVKTLESVPGSLVPRAELVVVDPPGPANRIVAWGVPMWALLFAAILIGLVMAALAAVVVAVRTTPATLTADASNSVSHRSRQVGLPTSTSECAEWT